VKNVQNYEPLCRKVKVKISLLQAMEAHGLREVEAIPHYLDKRLIDGGKVVSPTRQPHFTPRFLYFKNSWYSFLLEAETRP
jgi:hypothetical protein